MLKVKDKGAMTCALWEGYGVAVMDERSSGVRWKADGVFIAPVGEALPTCRNAAMGCGGVALGPCEVSPRVWGENDVDKTRLGDGGTDAEYGAVEPFGHCSVTVVVEGVHVPFVLVEASGQSVAVPAFPDGSGTLVDAV